jgi:hypothetical protein
MKLLSLFLVWGLGLSLRAESPAPPASTPAAVDWKMLDRTSAEISNGMHNAKISYPADLQALNNKPVAIVGFMTPFEDLSDMTKFLLMPTSGGCFFCNPPSMTQVLMVEQLKDGKKRHDFIGDTIMVTGTLRLYSKDSKHPAHLAEFIYALDDAKVEVCDGKNKPPANPAP